MKTCQQCQSLFEVTDQDHQFYDKVSPIFNGKKYLIPEPTLCPDCRRQRRLSFRNERFLYHRKCDLTGRQIISAYSSDKPYKTYQSDEWFSDKWDPLAYGRDFDFSRPFFEQFAELKKEVPRMALVTSPQAADYNCSYINFAGHSKNCYMTFDSDYNEDSYYTKVLKHSKSCMDCSFVHESEQCYECVDCYNCYRLFFSENSSQCSDSAFLKNCVGCKHCFFCSNLIQKEYCIYNKQYTKTEYEKIIQSLNFSSHAKLEKIRQDFAAFILRFPQKALHTLKVENSIGDYISNAQNCYESFDVADAKDLRYCDALYKAKDCCDVSSFGENIELCYEAGTAGINCYNMRFCFECVISCSDLLYCDECRHSSNCFGCAGVRHQYCILNKQYTKEQYQNLVPKIIEHMQKTGEWGQFFPPVLSAFGYNETVAQEYFPLTQEQTMKRGWNWHEEESEQKNYRGPQIEIPDDIRDVDDSLCSKILSCEITGMPYKIIPQELKFYRDMGLPVPHKSPHQRHMERFTLRNPRKLWNRECVNCNEKIQTTYASDRPETVYCEKCYLKTVY